jgi:integrase/recombinase XerD
LPSDFRLSALEPGRQLVRHSDGYRLRLAPAEMKNRTAYEAPLPASLTPWLDRYLAEIRPLLLAGRSCARLWISRDGTAMTVNSLSRRVEAVTGERLGRRLGMHLFRHCAATSLALAAPALAGAIPGLLGHQSLRTGERYYNLAGGSAAVAAYQAGLLALRQRLWAQAPREPGRGPAGARSVIGVRRSVVKT